MNSNIQMKSIFKKQMDFQFKIKVGESVTPTNTRKKKLMTFPKPIRKLKP